jgi:hypothetical protein
MDAMADPELPITGGCLCGGVRFEVSEPFAAAQYCHCTRCQRRSGTAFSASAAAVPGSLRIVEGEERVRAFRPDDGWAKFFCADCGGHLYSQSHEDTDQIGVRLGAVDGDPGVRPSSHQYVAYAAPWHPLPDDGLPRYDERMPAHD